MGGNTVIANYEEMNMELFSYFLFIVMGYAFCKVQYHYKRHMDGEYEAVSELTRLLLGILKKNEGIITIEKSVYESIHKGQFIDVEYGEDSVKIKDRG